MADQKAVLYADVILDEIHTQLAQLDFDANFDALTTIELEHAMIHAGRMYHADYNVADGSPVADNASVDVWISVPAACYPHIVASYWSEGLAQGYIYEAPTVDPSGTPLAILNRNRASTSESVLAVSHTPTVGAVGDPLHNGDWMGQANTPGPGGPGAARNGGGKELILNASTTYLYRITAREANIRLGIEMDWYE